MGRPRKVKEEVVTPDAEKAVESKVEEIIPKNQESAPVASVGVPPVGKINPPNPVIWKFICGTCHSCHILDEQMTNRNGLCMVLDRKSSLEGLELIELLCLRCGVATWKLVPKGVVPKGYANIALKKG